MRFFFLAPLHFVPEFHHNKTYTAWFMHSCHEGSPLLGQQPNKVYDIKELNGGFEKKKKSQHRISDRNNSKWQISLVVLLLILIFIWCHKTRVGIVYLIGMKKCIKNILCCVKNKEKRRDLKADWRKWSE